FRWLLSRPDVHFHAWIDARRLALPNQNDLTGDLVAAFRVGRSFEALCLELQASSRPDTAARLLLGYVPRLRTEPAGEGSLALSAVGGAVVNLTGQARPAALREAPSFAPACRLEGAVLQRTLRDEDAAVTLAAVEEGAVSRWLLCWLPLMRGGAEAGIIQGWRRQAARESDAINRASLGTLTLLFAVLGHGP